MYTAAYIQSSKKYLHHESENNQIWCILALKSDIIGDTNFSNFPERYLRLRTVESPKQFLPHPHYLYANLDELRDPYFRKLGRYEPSASVVSV